MYFVRLVSPDKRLTIHTLGKSDTMQGAKVILFDFVKEAMHICSQDEGMVVIHLGHGIRYGIVIIEA